MENVVDFKTGKPRTEPPNTQHVSILRMPVDIYAELAKAAKQCNRSVNNQIVFIVEGWLEKQKLKLNTKRD